ncbi:hypothetical protein [Nocardia sp. NPDC058114]
MTRLPHDAAMLASAGHLPAGGDRWAQWISDGLLVGYRRRDRSS